MFKGSEKEYEILKGEADTIKKSILQFIGFIISIAGVAVAIAKIYINPEDDNDYTLIVLGTITAGLVATTLLFEIIWYKFKSHNRLIGYIQLLTQEIGCVELTEEIKKKINSEDDSYLDNIRITSDPTKYSQNLFTWEYMMARLNNADFENSKLKIPIAIKKLHYKFAISDSNKYASISQYLRNYLGDLYFENVIKQMYTPEKKLHWKFLDKIFNAILGLLDLYIPIGYSLFRNKFKRINRDFLTTGWLFPKKVIQVVFFAIALMLLFFYSVLYSNFNLSFDNISYSVSFMAFLVFLIIFTWIFRYIGGLYSMIFGVHSAEYFGWSFFIFRVQLLNAYNIFPIYFSQNFIMYFKLIEKLDCHKILYNSVVQQESENCSICNKGKEKFHRFSPNSRFQGVSSVDQYDKICSDCGELYVSELKKASKISKKFAHFDSHIEKVGKKSKRMS